MSGCQKPLPATPIPKAPNIGARGSWMMSRRGSGGGEVGVTRGACADGRRENLPRFCRDRKIGRFPKCFPSFQKPGAGSVETGRFRGGGPKKVALKCAGTGETGNAGKPRKRTETSEPLVRGHPCPHWRTSRFRRGPSGEPDRLEHANDDLSVSGKCCRDAFDVNAGRDARGP